MINDESDVNSHVSRRRRSGELINDSLRPSFYAFSGIG